MIEKLNKAFCKLPGVGPKSAQRFIYHLLERDRQGGLDLSKALTETMENVKNCEGVGLYLKKLFAVFAKIILAMNPNCVLWKHPQTFMSSSRVVSIRENTLFLVAIFHQSMA